MIIRRSVTVLTGLSLAALTLAACAQVPGATPSSSGTSPATTTPATTPASTPATSSPSTAAPSSSTEPSGEASVPGHTEFTTVSAEDFKAVELAGVGGWVAQNSAGTVACGVFSTPTGTVAAGCQSKFEVPQMQDCGTNPDFMAPFVTFDTSGQVVSTCGTEGVFWLPNTKTLEDGQMFAANGYTIFAEDDGLGLVLNSLPVVFHLNESEGLTFPEA